MRCVSNVIFFSSKETYCFLQFSDNTHQLRKWIYVYVTWYTYIKNEIKYQTRDGVFWRSVSKHNDRMLSAPYPVLEIIFLSHVKWLSRRGLTLYQDYPTMCDCSRPRLIGCKWRKFLASLLMSESNTLSSNPYTDNKLLIPVWLDYSWVSYFPQIILSIFVLKPRNLSHEWNFVQGNLWFLILSCFSLRTAPVVNDMQWRSWHRDWHQQTYSEAVNFVFFTIGRHK